jgi:hypothetical protein
MSSSLLTVPDAFVAAVKAQQRAIYINIDGQWYVGHVDGDAVRVTPRDEWFADVRQPMSIFDNHLVTAMWDDGRIIEAQG